ncbi:MAG: hypothetical protein QXK18_02815 [Candidatus Bathyarchaeia archaeon]
MPQSERTQKIEELTERLSILKKQKSALEVEAKDYVEKRDTLNQELKNLRGEILRLKTTRDEVNAKVKELKQQRSQIKAEIAKKIAELKNLKKELEPLIKKKPKRSLKALEKDVESIEWKIQTTPLSLKEEKKLVEQVKELESQISVHKKIEQLNQIRIEVKAGLKALQARVELCHKTIMEKAEKSQQIHAEMLKKVEEAKKIKDEADSFHGLYLQAREKIKALQAEMTKILGEIRSFRGEISAEEEKKKKEAEEKLLESVEKQALEKLKRGEKLTWEEFKVLAEKGLA